MERQTDRVCRVSISTRRVERAVGCLAPAPFQLNVNNVRTARSTQIKVYAVRLLQGGFCRITALSLLRSRASEDAVTGFLNLLAAVVGQVPGSEAFVKSLLHRRTGLALNSTRMGWTDKVTRRQSPAESHGHGCAFLFSVTCNRPIRPTWAHLVSRLIDASGREIWDAVI